MLTTGVVSVPVSIGSAARIEAGFAGAVSGHLCLATVLALVRKATGGGFGLALTSAPDGFAGTVASPPVTASVGPPGGAVGVPLNPGTRLARGTSCMQQLIAVLIGRAGA